MLLKLTYGSCKVRRSGRRDVALPDRLLVLSGLFNSNLKKDKDLSIKLQTISGQEGRDLAPAVGTLRINFRKISDFARAVS